ncbi:MAG: hypothetical protein ACYDD5_00800 [Sulfuricurvum sp.]
MNSTDSVIDYSSWYQAATTGINKAQKIYTKEDFLKEFCGGMSMETLQQILREHAPEYLI